MFGRMVMLSEVEGLESDPEDVALMLPRADVMLDPRCEKFSAQTPISYDHVPFPFVLSGNQNIQRARFYPYTEMSILSL